MTPKSGKPRFRCKRVRETVRLALLRHEARDRLDDLAGICGLGNDRTAGPFGAHRVGIELRGVEEEWHAALAERARDRLAGFPIELEIENRCGKILLGDRAQG